jgi:DNA gyrase/topoisomerase IV subunit A
MEKENFFTNGKQKITPIEIGREMQDSFLQYAMSSLPVPCRTCGTV